MSLPSPSAEASYFEDGHTISFKWEKDSISIGAVHCPYRGKVAACTRNRLSCVVDSYLKVYGTELNIGVTWLSDSVEIAWIPIAGESDIDDEYGTIWVVPIDDPDFQAIRALREQFDMAAFDPDSDEVEVISDTDVIPENEDDFPDDPSLNMK